MTIGRIVTTSGVLEVTEGYRPTARSSTRESPADARRCGGRPLSC